MPWTVVKLNEEKYKELIIQEKRASKPQILKRIQCIKLKNLGWKNYEIAKFLVVNQQTISNWLQIYSKEGLEGLLEWNYCGKTAVLTKEQRRELRLLYKKKILTGVEDTMKFIKVNYGYDFSPLIVEKLISFNFNCKKRKKRTVSNTTKAD